MTTRPTLPRVLAALVTGVATAAYYATPDLIRSRTARGWTKAALLAVATAPTVPDLLHDRAAARARTAAHVADARAADENRTADEADVPSWRDVRPAAKATVVGVGAAALALSVAGTAAFERWVFRRAEARGAAGVSYPHTRVGIVMGVLSAALALVPAPADDEAARDRVG